MNWLTVLQNVAFFAVASGLLTWLIKKLVDQSLKRDLEAFKAELAQAHAIQMEEAKNRFTVGAMSHMADVAFDKHVSFCEEYTAAAYGAMRTLFRRGPHEAVLEDAGRLSDIRIKWAVWLHPATSAELEKFERALQTIGAEAWLLKELRPDEDRSEVVAKVFTTFAEVMGFKTWKGIDLTEEFTIDKVIEKLRSVLGIDELTHLRTELVERASQNLK